MMEQTFPSPAYDLRPSSLATLEDLHREFEAFYLKLHADIPGLLSPLKEDICRELGRYGSKLIKLQREATLAAHDSGKAQTHDVASIAGGASKGISSAEMEGDGSRRPSEDSDPFSRMTSIKSCGVTEPAGPKYIGTHIMPPPVDAEASSTQDTQVLDLTEDVTSKSVLEQDVSLSNSTDSTIVRAENEFAVPGTVSTEYNVWSSVIPAADDTHATSTSISGVPRPSQLLLQNSGSIVSGGTDDALHDCPDMATRCSTYSSASKTIATKQPQTPSVRNLSTHNSRQTRRSTAELQKFESDLFSSIGKNKSLRQMALRIVRHDYFDYAVALFILMNGGLVGVQTDWMARNLKEVPPVPFQVLEWIFGICFTGELGFRFFAYRWSFFTMVGMGWNLFDLAIVMLQWFEILLELMAAGLGLDFSLLRILRLVRVIRLARALRLIGELRTIVSSIAGSMKSLLWTGVLLFMIVYVLGVGFTQVVLNKRIKIEKKEEIVPPDLEKFWGHLISAIFTLFEAITGGLDWDDAVRPLIEHVGPEWGIVFTLYITFSVLAMLNVVTGVFIDSVMKNASDENDLRVANHIIHLFRSLDVDADGELTWDQFQGQLDKREMKEFFKSINVDIANAQTLFNLLDLDESGEVNAKEFVDGCRRIWSPAKGTDIQMIRHDINRLARVFQNLDDKFGERVLEHLPLHVSSAISARRDLAQRF